ncbi:ATP-binding cassette domain-containing protein [Caenimonas soli]|uniref:ATP-binding cassette domain-containing protein n=1 Tax=Caenimonas soli TaxID=2735555 RepID=UPI0015547A83|nr:ATP-binding cassette domain-containing protein [Caenimonas soli]NPC56388.1 ATP-binding cassette domain-containing protein [Caenimonas soli]
MTLRLSNLHAGYGRIEVCREIAMTLADGEFLAVLGPNGAGKSTLLGAIAGSVNGRGQIELNGVRLDHMNARARARHGLALVPEGRRNLFSPLTVHENLQLGLRLLAAAERPRMLEELMAMFPILGSRRAQLSGLLSGGEQQMLALAVALARRPSVLLLDEPSQGLAPLVLQNLAAQIGSLRKLGVSVLLAEQNHRFAAQLCDRYVVLSSGELSGGGGGEELQDADRVASALMSA